MGYENVPLNILIISCFIRVNMIATSALYYAKHYAVRSITFY